MGRVRRTASTARKLTVLTLGQAALRTHQDAQRLSPSSAHINWYLPRSKMSGPSDAVDLVRGAFFGGAGA